MSTGFGGGCLCGSVRYESSIKPVVAVHCYCLNCRKWSGTGHASNMAVPESAFSVSGELTFYDVEADSGNTVTKGFCPTCGSSIYNLNSGMPGMVFPLASSLDDLEVFKPGLIVYASRAASWDHIPPGLPTFQEMPPPESVPTPDN